MQCVVNDYQTGSGVRKRFYTGVFVGKCLNIHQFSFRDAVARHARAMQEYDDPAVPPERPVDRAAARRHPRNGGAAELNP